MPSTIITVDNIADIVATTLKNLGRFKITNLAYNLQDYIGMRELFNAKKIQIDDGIGLEWNIMTDTNDAARYVGLYATDTVHVGDFMQKANAAWKNCTVSYAFERRELKFNRGASRIVDKVKTQRMAAHIDQVELFEAGLWNCPQGSEDVLTPNGIPYYIVTNATEGFNGGVPKYGSGLAFSDCAGLSPTTYPRWRNWTAQYTDITKADLVRKWRKAMRFTKFKSPTPNEDIPEYDEGKGGRGFYTTYTVLATLEEMLESQNDNLGNDIASKDGEVMFRRTPVTWVPYLEDNAPYGGTDPIYGIDWATFFPYFLEGEFMREEVIKGAANAHTVTAVHIDSTFNFVCKNRRRNFVLAKSVV